MPLPNNAKNINELAQELSLSVKNTLNSEKRNSRSPELAHPLLLVGAVAVISEMRDSLDNMASQEEHIREETLKKICEDFQLIVAQLHSMRSEHARMVRQQIRRRLTQLAAITLSDAAKKEIVRIDNMLEEILPIEKDPYFKNHT